jgi:hypothetical protein
MITFLASLSAYVVISTLAVAGVTHGVRPHDFKEALATHGMWPSRALQPLAVFISAVEITIAVAAALALIDGEGRGGPAASFAAAAVLFFTYSVYAGYLVRHRPHARCGCSTSGLTPTNVWVVTRAAVLTVLAATAYLASGSILASGGDGADLAIVALASGAIGVALWYLPDALVNHPAGTPLQQGVPQ